MNEPKLFLFKLRCNFKAI